MFKLNRKSVSTDRNVETFQKKREGKTISIDWNI